MPEKHLHIVSFTIPFPPNYGGVIDVYHKIRALHELDVAIHLHCFEYDRRPAAELNELCESVTYYKRKTGLRFTLGRIPYIVLSRRSEELIHNLLKDNFPILFEGLHTCYYLNDPRLKDRKKIYRESNIEHYYYFSLYKAEKNWIRKIYFLLASIKLKRYERVLKHADLMLAVSRKDEEYLREQFPGVPVRYLPSFHSNSQVTCQAGKGNYCLYHGNLSVAENSVAAAFLIREVFPELGIDLKIAGHNPPRYLKKLAQNIRNVQIIESPSDDDLNKLIVNAHVNILVTFQATGLKLKLLNTLFSGRFILVNNAMLNGTELNELCIIADSPQKLRKELVRLHGERFEEHEISRRRSVLSVHYSNHENAGRLVEYIF
jgi:hypothetical protein